MSRQKEYRVRDFWLAATLVALGMTILGAEVQPRRPGERPGPPWTVIILQDRPDRPRLEADYRAGRLRVNPAKLSAAFRLCQRVREAALRDAREGAPGA